MTEELSVRLERLVWGSGRIVKNHLPESHPVWPLGFLVGSVSAYQLRTQRKGDELEGEAERLSMKKQ